jgi:hypothetical protein
VPVLLAGLEKHAVTRADDLDRPAAPLHPANTFGDVESLAFGVRMPGRSGTWRKVDVDRLQARGR